MIDQAAITRTFLITDIEGSTRLWEDHREAMAPALEAHDRLLASAVEQAGGIVVKTTGDGLLAVFDAVDAAIGAALAGQRALAANGWGATGPLRVRMAIPTGAAHRRDDDYFGPVLNRVARLLAIGHGGQVLASGVDLHGGRGRLLGRPGLTECGLQRLILSHESSRPATAPGVHLA